MSPNMHEEVVVNYCRLFKGDSNALELIGVSFEDRGSARKQVFIAVKSSIVRCQLGSNLPSLTVRK